METSVYDLVPVCLPESSEYFRIPPRPKASQQENYQDLFDFRMLFADVFLDRGRLAAVGAPPLNLREGLANANYYLNGKAIKPPKIEDRSLCAVYLFDESADIGDEFRIEAFGCVWNAKLQDNRSDFFKGNDVLLAVQKDNRLEWVAYWALHHSIVSGVDAILLYDNGSTTYGADDLIKVLELVPGLDKVLVCSSECPFGPTGGADGIWDSNYGQLIHYEHARRTSLRASRSVLVNDIDELIGVPGGGTVIERLTKSAKPAIGIPRTNILNVLRPGFTEEDTRAHNVYGYRRNPMTRLHGKYAAKTQELSENAQLNVHLIRHTRFEKIEAGEMICGNFVGVSTTWRTGKFETRRNVKKGDLDVSLVKPLTSSMDSIDDQWDQLLHRLKSEGLVD